MLSPWPVIQLTVLTLSLKTLSVATSNLKSFLSEYYVRCSLSLLVMLVWVSVSVSVCLCLCVCVCVSYATTLCVIIICYRVSHNNVCCFV